MVRLLWLEKYNMMMWCGLLKFWEKGVLCTIRTVRSAIRRSRFYLCNERLGCCTVPIWDLKRWIAERTARLVRCCAQPHSTILGWCSLFEFWLRFWKKTKERLEPLMWEMGVDERYIQYWPLFYVLEVNSEFYQYVLTRKRHNRLFIKLAP